MASINELVSDARVLPALQHMQRHVDQIVNLGIAVQQIPAPTFSEELRAQFVCEQFEVLGLADVSIDHMHNVYGRLPGRTSSLPPVVVSAHSDTVFPSDTNLTVRRDAGLIYGPGIADNSMGVAGMLSLAGTMRKFQLQTNRDIWFVCNVGEEGLGNLRGMRTVVERFGNAQYIVIEGGMYGYLLHEAIGVKRFRVDVETDGGHSWSDFGRVSAIHVLGRVIAELDGMRVPRSPKTTYNVGVIEGGTSINTIAARASLLLDLRSEDFESLSYLVSQFEMIIKKLQRRYAPAHIATRQIGDRPAGSIPRRSLIVKQADAALRAVGCTRIQYLCGSTDANIPLSEGFPAVCIGLARSANAHRLDEYLDTAELPRGMQQLLLLTLATAELS